MVKRKRNSSGQFEARYPFGELEAVGDFFTVKLSKKKEDFRERYNRIRSSAHIYAKRNSVKFSCKTVDEGVRVTRTK